MYDANGNDAYQYIEEKTMYYSENRVYDKTTQSAESLLVKRDLPFDFFIVYPWKSVVLKGFVYEGVVSEKTGNLPGFFAWL